MASLTALFVVLLSNGALPGMANYSASAFVVEGRIRCLNQTGVSAFALRCEALGFPFGYPVLTGGPLVGVGALLMLIPGVGSGGAYIASSAIWLSIALGAGYFLVRRLGAGPVVALGTATVYLISPTVLGLHGFGGTFFGFALLPAYVLVDLAMGDALKSNGRGRALTVLAILLAVRVLALFMDGYSFVASALLGGLVWLDWALRGDDLRRSRRWGGPSMYLLGNLGAVALYMLHAQANYSRAPLALFRSMGLDVTTLWLPTRSLWFAKELGLAVNHSGLWGDGTNANHNYAGITCVVLAAAYLLLKPSDRRAVVLAAAGVLTLVLSLGPAFKVGEQRPPISGIPTHASYMMPEGEAVELPWGGLFTELPGLYSMRATYRWFGVTRMALIILAGLAVAEMIRRPGLARWTAVVLAAVAVVELAPDVAARASVYRENRREINVVSEQVEPQLRAVTKPGQRVFFLNYDGSHNDWMVNYLAPAAGLVAYNAGGDKNAALSRARWPEEVRALAEADVAADDLYRSFYSGHVDAVVVPFFHLRHAAYSWPPSIEQQLDARMSFDEILSDERFEVESQRWFAVVSLGGS
ncbi:MAG: hypothetical protein WD602_09200 [Actinomycetota bacterium]